LWRTKIKGKVLKKLNMKFFPLGMCWILVFVVGGNVFFEFSMVEMMGRMATF
jgi:hypothetical protein